MNTTHAAQAARQMSKIRILFSKMASMDMDSNCDAYAVQEQILDRCYDQMAELVDKIESGEV